MPELDRGQRTSGESTGIVHLGPQIPWKEDAQEAQMHISRHSSYASPLQRDRDPPK